MMTAKLFENGRSQAVRLPKECRFNGDEVAISKEVRYYDDFMSEGREQPAMQERESL